MRWAAPGALLVLVLAGCAAGAAGRAEGEGEGRVDGGRLYRSRCASCHRLRDPSEQTAEEWARLVARYGPRAHLSPGEEEAIRRWLQERARP